MSPAGPGRAGVPRAPRVIAARVTAAQDGCRLDVFLAAWLPGPLRQQLSKAALRKLIMAGAVRVEGRAARRPGLELRPGMRVQVAARLERLQPGPAQRAPVPVPARSVRVLHEDRWLIAVDKPPGLPTHATADPRRAHLVGAVQAYLTAARPPAESAYLAVHQRLDQDTSGVVLFAKDPAANAGLASQFAQRRVEKVYVALVARRIEDPPPTWTVENRLGRSGGGRAARTTGVPAGGVTARTDFRVLARFPRGLLIEARPRTGRRHQVRAHLAQCGLPILGDELYGGKRTARGSDVPRAMLHAARLMLRHPVTGVALAIESPTPDDFAAAQAGLRARA